MKRGDIDDRAPPGGLHRRQDGARRKPGGFEVDREHVVPFLLGHRDRIGVDVAPSVVDEPGDRSELRRGLLDDAFEVRGPRDVAGREMRAPARAERLEEIATRRLLEIDERNACALSQRLGDDCGADPRAPPVTNTCCPAIRPANGYFLSIRGNRRQRPVTD